MEKEIQKIKNWLSLPVLEKDLEAGALLFLRNNPRKRILYDNILRRRFMEKLVYELEKTLEVLEVKVDAVQRGIDYKKLTADEVKAFNESAAIVEKVTMPKVVKLDEEKSGKRPDHDALPDTVQAMYEENLRIYPRMRALHEKLKLMDNEPACDRYPFLKQLIAYDETLNNNWNAYDNYDIANPPAQPTAQVIDFNRISADRKYISTNKEKLAVMKSDPNQAEAYLDLLKNMQTRVDELLSVEQKISEDQANELRALGLKVGEEPTEVPTSTPEDENG